MIISPYNKLSPFGTSLNEAGIPLPNNTLFHLDGSISGSEFVDISGNGKNFTITNKDFTTFYFPYKSAATISAPSGDLALFTALGGANSFWYGANEDSPNEIPIVSFFPNIDYGNQFFNRHVPQTVDGNGVETQEPYVTDIVAYDAALTGDDLTTANSYYGVPTEIITNVSAVSEGGNTLAQAYAAITAGGTIYWNSVELYATLSIAKNLSIIGTGLSSLAYSGTYAFQQSASETSFKNMVISSTTAGLRGTAVTGININIDKCQITSSRVLWRTAPYPDTFIIENSYLYGEMDVKLTTPGSITINSCLINSIAYASLAVNGGSYEINNSILYSGTGSVIYYEGAANISLLGCTIYDKLFAMSVARIYKISVTRCNLHNVNGVANIVLLYDASEEIDISDNVFTNASETLKRPIQLANQTSAVTINRNTINDFTYYLEAFDCSDVEIIGNIGTGITPRILTKNSKVDIEENILTSTTGIAAINVKAPDTDVGACSIKNNVVVQTINQNSALIHVGTTNTYYAADITNLSGTIIEENKAIQIPDEFSHGGINVYGKNGITVRHNFTKNTDIGIGFKAASVGGQDYYDVVAHNNLLLNAHILARGVFGAKSYNNTIVAKTTGVTHYGIDIIWDGVYESKDLEFKNNIVVATTGNILVRVNETESIAGLDMDYNIYYSPDPTPFDYLGTDYNFEDWKTQSGVDANSIFLTEAQFNALFTDYDNDDYSLGSNSVAKDFCPVISGYGERLAASTVWGANDELADVVTITESGTGSCGAYVS